MAAAWLVLILATAPGPTRPAAIGDVAANALSFLTACRRAD